MGRITQASSGTAIGAQGLGVSLCAAPTATLYVSPSGSDANPGTKAAPFLTLARAQTVARLLGASTICLRGGTYYLAAALALTSADNGTTWLGYPGETPVLSGGVLVTGAWVNTSGAIWRVPYSGSVIPRAVWYNGTRCTRAQSTAAALSIPGGLASNGTTGYTNTSGWLQSYGNPADIEFVFRDSLDSAFREMRMPVASIDATTITMTSGFAQAVALHNTFGWSDIPAYVEHALEILTSVAAVGTFYLDRSAHYLYLISADGSNPNTATVVVAGLEQLLTVTGVANVAFYGVSFRHANWLQPSRAAGFAGYTLGTYVTTQTVFTDLVYVTTSTAAVEVNASNKVNFTRCFFEQMGAATALWIHAGNQDCVVRGSVFRDLSGTGVYLGAAEVSEQNPVPAVARTVIDNNVIHDVGLELVASYGLISFYADGTQITHNLIHHTALGGIHVGYGWNESVSYPNVQRNVTIAYNLVHHTFLTGDGSGSIHTIGHHPGSTVRGNVVHDMQALSSAAYYFDEGTQNLLATGNLAYSNPGLKVLASNGSAGNNIFTNTTADSGSTQYNPNFSGSDSADPINVVSTAAAIVAAAATGAGLQSGYLDLANL